MINPSTHGEEQTLQIFYVFEKDYPNAKVIILEENYRSTKNIIDAANEIIKKNKDRVEKKLFTKQEAGEKISIYGAADETEEANFIAKKTKELIGGGVDPKNISVLYRANFQSRVLEEVFIREKISHQVLGVRFFDRKEIKDVIAFVKSALNPKDLNNIERIINIPPRGIGKVTVAKIFSGKKDLLSANVKQKVDSFFSLLNEIRAKSKDISPSLLIKFIIQETGVEASFKKGTEDELEKLGNIKELVSLASKYDSIDKDVALEQFLEDASLMTSDQDSIEDKKGVKLMTVHAAKGLEFEYVFIVGLEEDLFPHQGFGEENRDEEEERRLFYVALTRAKKKLFLTYTHKRTLFGQEQMNLPSQFIFDIDEGLTEPENEYEAVIQLD